ncbi:ArdC family protein [Aquamicrobium sp.]|uniref:ArdC family protein n=1 Tax=Aquamicrobium sp. TaxID=1872579 RepID=UPI00258BA77E|nr:ArdC family protein [Aquamicrobium sp.]MCK9549489.1 ArdC family protein [Aquamicrobium sp.]
MKKENTTPKKSTKELLEELNNELIDSLTRGVNPFSIIPLQSNLQGKIYAGLNQLILAHAKRKHNYSSNLWGTVNAYNREYNNKNKVNKGEKGTILFYWSKAILLIATNKGRTEKHWLDEKEDITQFCKEKGLQYVSKEEKVFQKHFSVFNGNQTMYGLDENEKLFDFVLLNEAINDNFNTTDAGASYYDVKANMIVGLKEDIDFFGFETIANATLGKSGLNVLEELSVDEIRIVNFISASFLAATTAKNPETQFVSEVVDLVLKKIESNNLAKYINLASDVYSYISKIYKNTEKTKRKIS